VRELKKIIPMKRMGNKEDLISALKFLIDDENPYITGQNIIIDGGRTII
jgi:NAD(P)-dependent dehydrogenase (short-subunit alcohol dehydrogenase family)